MSPNEKKRRPFWPWIIAVLIGGPLLYLASLPLLMWAWRNDCIPRGSVRESVAARYCYPVLYLTDLGSPDVRRGIEWYLTLLTK